MGPGLIRLAVLFAAIAGVLAASGCSKAPSENDSMAATLEQAKKDQGIKGNEVRSKMDRMKAPGPSAQ